MNYPLLSEYVESIRSAEDNLAELNYLQSVLDANGDPVMTGGNFAVVFKMQDKNTGKFYALKCFTKEQEGRAEAYRMIAEELEFVNTTYFTHFKYYDKELFVDSANSDETEFPVVLMDWVEGVTLDKYIREHIDDKYELSLLAYQFSRLAMWLLPQPYAHGDLKPDNILVKDDSTLVLVDYDGMYVPAMKGQKARELGSPDFRHPLRTENDFDEHIDDFALASILLSLKAISLNPDLLEQYGASDRLLFSEKDYRNISNCELLHELYPSNDSELNLLIGLFTIAKEKSNLSYVSTRLFNLKRPKKREMSDEEVNEWPAAWAEAEERAPYEIDSSWSFITFAKDFVSMFIGSYFCSVTGGEEEACLFRRKNGEEVAVFWEGYNGNGLCIEYIKSNIDLLRIGLMKSGHYTLYTSYLLDPNEDNYIIDYTIKDLHLVIKEIVDSFEGKDNVTHILFKGVDNWITKGRSFDDESKIKGAIGLATVEKDNKHVFFLFDDNDDEVGRYYLGRNLQGKRHDELMKIRNSLIFFDSWNPLINKWVPCVGLNNTQSTYSKKVGNFNEF